MKSFGATSARCQGLRNSFSFSSGWPDPNFARSTNLVSKPKPPFRTRTSFLYGFETAGLQPVAKGCKTAAASVSGGHGLNFARVSKVLQLQLHNLLAIGFRNCWLARFASPQIKASLQLQPAAKGLRPNFARFINLVLIGSLKC